MNRYQESAKRIIDGRNGSLQKPLILTNDIGWDYTAQQPDNQVFLNTTGLKTKLTKSELERQNVQLGDFGIIFTADFEVNVDNTQVVFDGVACQVVSVVDLAADAAQTIIARVK